MPAPGTAYQKENKIDKKYKQNTIKYLHKVLSYQSSHSHIWKGTTDTLE